MPSQQRAKLRKRFPKEVESAVLLACKRKCAFCFGIDGDSSEKEGQIAHVDDPADASIENAAWLCTKHHARYDSKSRQTKGYTPAELKKYRSQVVQYCTEPPAWPDLAAHVRTPRGRGVVLDVFDRRVPTYRATITFLRYACQINDLELQELMKFARDTDEALFLFDDGLADYLSTLFKKAMHLRAIGLEMQDLERRTPELINEQSELALWFTEQFEETRRRFAPFLRIRDAG
jgi:hypothetical protein